MVRILDDEILREIAEKELYKLMKEDDSMDIVRRSDLVLERLHQLYATSQANALYATWTKLVQFGDVQAKETISRATFTDIKDADRSRSNMELRRSKLKQFSIVPNDFSFTSERYVLADVDREVIENLNRSRNRKILRE